MHSNTLFGLFRDPILPSAQCTWSNPLVHLAPASAQESHHTIHQSLQRVKVNRNCRCERKQPGFLLVALSWSCFLTSKKQKKCNMILYFPLFVTFQNTTRFWKNNTNLFHTGNHYCFWCSASSIAWWWLTQEDTGWLAGKGWHHEISRRIWSTYLSGRSVGSRISPTIWRIPTEKCKKKQAEAMNIHESWTFMWGCHVTRAWRGYWKHWAFLDSSHSHGSVKRALELSWSIIILVRYLLPSPFTGRVHWILTMDPLPFPQRTSHFPRCF